MPMNRTNEYLSGLRLYGDDFSKEQLAQWYAEEEYAYFQMATMNEAYISESSYEYNAMNWWHGFRLLGSKKFSHCLGLGAASGDDVAPLGGVVDRFTIVEPAEQYWRESIAGRPATYIKPTTTGDLPFDSSTVDLVTAFSVLHHIANVSHVLCEIGRVLAPGGRLLLREPIHSMGDWSRPRNGLTKNERGIPVALLKRYLNDAGLCVLRLRYCDFAPLSKLYRSRLFRTPTWNISWLQPIDEFLCFLFSWNDTYHRTLMIRKFAPGGVFLVAERRAESTRS